MAWRLLIFLQEMNLLLMPVSLYNSCAISVSSCMYFLELYDSFCFYVNHGPTDNMSTKCCLGLLYDAAALDCDASQLGEL
jgi:hypothetical protein